MHSIELPKKVAFAGFDASGKDSLALLLSKEFTHIPVVGLGDILKDIATILTLDGDDREVRRMLSKQLAEQYNDPAIMARLAMGEYDEISINGSTIEFGNRYANENGELYVTSVRRVAEAEALKKAGSALLWIHAPIELRYERKKRRMRESDASILTFDDFVKDGETEMYGTEPGSLTEVNVSRVLGAADYIYNNPDRERSEMVAHLAQTFRLPRL